MLKISDNAMVEMDLTGVHPEITVVGQEIPAGPYRHTVVQLKRTVIGPQTPLDGGLELRLTRLGAAQLCEALIEALEIEVGDESTFHAKRLERRLADIGNTMGTARSKLYTPWISTKNGNWSNAQIVTLCPQAIDTAMHSLEEATNKVTALIQDIAATERV